MQLNTRYGDLEKSFSELEPQLKESPEKQALSILHAMLVEIRQSFAQSGEQRPSQERGVTLETIANLHQSAPAMEGKAENDGLAPGVEAPDFSLPDADGKKVALSSFRGKNVVLVFYPLDWSPACSDQLSLYQSEIETFKELDAQVLAISVDSLYSHGAWTAVRGLEFPLLADFHPKGEVSEKYGVMRRSDGFSERALFVIDRQGIIRGRTISPELHKIPDIYELIDQLKQVNSQERA